MSKSSKNNNSIGKLIGDIIFWGFIAFFAFCIIFFKFRYVQTGSMKPELEIGSITVINPHSEPHVGDIAMYKLGDGYVIHRIVKATNGEYIFQGDNVGEPDSEVITKERIVGKVVGKCNWIAPLIRTIYHLEA